MSQNGKGATPRRQTAEEAKRFAREYDRIFRKPKKAKGRKR